MSLTAAVEEMTSRLRLGPNAFAVSSSSNEEVQDAIENSLKKITLPEPILPPSGISRYCNTCYRLLRNDENCLNSPFCTFCDLFVRQPMYYCSFCNTIEFTEPDFFIHIISEKHQKNCNERNYFGTSFSYYCKICKYTIYGSFGSICMHRMQSHSQNPMRLPVLCVLQSAAFKHFNANTADDTVMFACLRCRQFGPVNQTTPAYTNHCVECKHVNKYYCPICNIIFSCTSMAFKMHALSFEHIFTASYKFHNNYRLV